MKKRLLLLATVLMMLIQTSSYSATQTTTIAPLKVAIKKYKSGNYSGCLQDCQYITKKYPSNAVAYYYLAISYVQAGKQKEAIDAYSKVLSLNPGAKLSEYANTGKRCLETPDKCVLETDSNSSELDKLIASPSNDGLSNAVRKDIMQKRLDLLKYEMNNDKYIDNSSGQKLNQSSVTDKIAQKQPTNDEIVAALRVLKEAGLDPYSSEKSVQSKAPVPSASTEEINSSAQANNYQNPELTQLNMLMGSNNQSKDSNQVLNMIPFMLSQNKNGTSNYSPQLMQAVIMNSMMPDFNLNLDKDK